MIKHINYYFLGLSFFLLFFGLLFLSTLSAISSLQIFNNTNYYLFRQLYAVGIGILGGIIIFKIPLGFLKKISPLLLILNIIAALMVFLPGIGAKFWGASRWVIIGGTVFQPTEFLKLTSIIYFSAWLTNKYHEGMKKNLEAVVKKSYYNLIKVFIPFLTILSTIIIILILQKDLSTLGVIMVALISIYFAAQTPLWHTVITITGVTAAMAAFVFFEPYRFNRFFIFLNPENDPLGKGLQSTQSLIALGSGGLFGKGLGMSTQKFGFLPAAMSDSIFAIIGEEVGIIGSASLILLFVAFLWFGFKIARHASSMFGKVAATGVTMWIVFQAFINIASVIGIFPVSGLPLPFFSYGGSHIVAELLAVGLLLNISKNG